MNLAVGVKANESISVERQIYTAAHELGHILLHPDSYKLQKELDYDKHENRMSLLVREALLLGRKGTIDKLLYINEKFWAVDTMFYAIVNDNQLAKYLYYLLTTIPFEFYSTSAALPSMTQKDFLKK